MNRLSVRQRKSGVLFILKCIVLFFFLFQIHFKFMPSWLGTEQLSIIIIFVLFWISNPKVCLRCTKTMYSMLAINILFLFMLLYSSLAVYITDSKDISGNVYLYKYCFYCIAIIIVGGLGFASLFEDLEEFMNALLICEVIQAVFIICFAVLPDVRQICNMIFNTADLYSKYASDIGYHTGIGVAEAKGAMKMVPGLGACIYLCLHKKRNFRYIISYILISISSSLLARTGMVFVLLSGLFFVCISGKYKIRVLKITSVLVCIIVFSIITLYLSGAVENVYMHFYRFGRLYREFMEGGIQNITFFQKYFGIGSTNTIPELSLETMVGTGIMSGISGSGTKIISDGGYLKLYFSVGLPLALFFYGFILWTLNSFIKKITDPVLRSVMYFMLLYIFIGEFKEVHIFFGYPLCLIYVMGLLYERTYYMERKLAAGKVGEGNYA